MEENIAFDAKHNGVKKIMKPSLQSRTGPVQGQNRVFPVKFFSQGKTCFHYREPLFSLQGPCFHYRDFPVRKTSQGKPCFYYREWVCSVHILINFSISKRGKIGLAELIRVSRGIPVNETVLFISFHKEVPEEM